jgi:YbgC/YbaW family acyl-CoA thioester hydrolase
MNSVFESEITIRPDDIDLNNHVHNTKYLDYILAARFDQMIKYYKMTIKDFEELGYSWVVSDTFIEYKRALTLYDKILVRTQMGTVNGAQCKVNFWIVKKENNKIAAQGYLTYTMVSLKNGRPVRIPKEIINKYSI